MARILVLYASFDGQTARIAERIGGLLKQAGHAISLRCAQAPGAIHEIEAHDAVIVGGAIRYGHHARYLEGLVRDRAAAIAARPNGFFSVCLSAGGPGAKPEQAKRYVDEFCRRTGWHPDETAVFAGALLYRKYNPLIRVLMRLIVGAAGGHTDTSRNYEYTDWQSVERFAAGFAAKVDKLLRRMNADIPRCL